MKNILLVLSFCLTFLITFDLFLKEPPVWPDEASLAYMSSSIVPAEGKFNNYPSIYIALLSTAFKIFGTSIEVQRMMSLFAGLACIAVFYLLVFIINKREQQISFYKIIPIILLVTDFTFLQAMRIGRPEIYALMCGLISIYFLYKFIYNQSSKLLFLGVSFIFAILSILFHSNGFIYLLTILISIIFLFKKLSKNNQMILIVSFFCMIILTFLLGSSFIPSWTTLTTRFMIANAQNTWLITVLSEKPLELKLIYLSFIAISLLFLRYIYKKRGIYLYIIGVPLLLSWIILIFNKDFWYAVYLIPFTSLAVLVLLNNYYKNRLKFFALVIVCSVLFLSNLKLHINILLAEGGNKYSYQQFIQGIQEVIPDGKSVFTSAIPDPYYAFVDRKNNKVIRFPQSFVKKGTYLNELNQTDFIIYNGPFGNNYYGDIVMDYIKLNVFKVTQIGSAGQYQAMIVELKPRDQRVSP